MNNLQSTKVLIIEDEQITSWHIQEILENEGYQVSAMVASGEAAIASVSSIKPDLALMDIRLDGEMSGIEAAAILYNTFNIPVVYLTAYGDEVTLTKAKQTSPFGYLVKPFEAKELHATIQIALQRHDYEDEAKATQQLLTEHNITLAKAIAMSAIANQTKIGLLANKIAELLTDEM